MCACEITKAAKFGQQAGFSSSPGVRIGIVNYCGLLIALFYEP